MKKYFLIWASADHVTTGVNNGFAQAGHGRKNLMSKPAKNDGVVYYSAKDALENGKPLQAFTAIGHFTDSEPYQPGTSPHFKPYRRNVHYKKANPTAIRPLLEQLSFIKNKQRWGVYLISGFREISAADFEIIEHAMQ